MIEIIPITTKTCGCGRKFLATVETECMVCVLRTEFEQMKTDRTEA